MADVFPRPPLGFDRDLDEREEALAFHAATSYMQHLLGLSFDEVVKRFGINHVRRPSEMVLRICVDGCNIHDGLQLPDCKHGGLAKGGGMRLHGTSNLSGFLTSGGKFTLIRRPLKGYEGWCHCSIENLEKAMEYAYPFEVHACGRSFWFRAMLEVDTLCWNSCNKKYWCYTKECCLRYSVHSVYLFPCHTCKDIGFIHPNDWWRLCRNKNKIPHCMCMFTCSLEGYRYKGRRQRRKPFNSCSLMPQDSCFCIVFNCMQVCYNSVHLIIKHGVMGAKPSLHPLAEAVERGVRKASPSWDAELEVQATAWEAKGSYCSSRLCKHIHINRVIKYKLV